MQDNESKSTVSKITVYWDKFKNSWVYRPLVILMSFTIIIIILLLYFSWILPYTLHSTIQDAMRNYNNSSTMAGMYVSTETNLLMFVTTVAYVILTLFLVNETSNAVTQTRKEQQIRDIENRLEKFYIPAIDIINGSLQKKKHEIIRGEPSENLDGLVSISKYSYLAEKNTYKAYDKFITKDCKNFKLNICDELYRDTDDYECPSATEGCRDSWFVCEENIEFCEYFDKCPRKDGDGTIINNTYCNYYIELKDKITEDIENYKKKLDELKE